MIERELPDGLSISQDQDGVTWIHSYATPGSKHTFCIYDGPTPEAIRRAAARNKLPISRITEVGVLDPYFYR
ncbi:MAG: DUF4242 domain-containing protein [Steroidobacteraceae bacterium]